MKNRSYKIIGFPDFAVVAVASPSAETTFAVVVGPSSSVASSAELFASDRAFALEHSSGCYLQALTEQIPEPVALALAFASVASSSSAAASSSPAAAYFPAVSSSPSSSYSPDP